MLLTTSITPYARPLRYSFDALAAVRCKPSQSSAGPRVSCRRFENRVDVGWFFYPNPSIETRAFAARLICRRSGVAWCRFSRLLATFSGGEKNFWSCDARKSRITDRISITPEQRHSDAAIAPRCNFVQNASLHRLFLSQLTQEDFQPAPRGGCRVRLRQPSLYLHKQKISTSAVDIRGAAIHLPHHDPTVRRPYNYHLRLLSPTRVY